MMRIGLTYTGDEKKHQNYVEWLKGDEGTAAEIVRLSAEDGNLEELRHCDGLVLSGGVDIEPVLYDGSPSYDMQPRHGWQMDRDLFEKAALELAWERELPVLGVCRGLQLINVALGGSLVQDLGIVGNKTHKAEKLVDRQHGVMLEAGGLLREIVGKNAGVVNSAHHQAVDKLGEGLRVNCRAEDETIEGLEWADRARKPFMLAVQWHPERMYVNGLADAALYRAIRDRFMEEVGKAMAAIRPGDKKNNQ
jgi:putative glutamine amidotransferase